MSRVFSVLSDVLEEKVLNTFEVLAVVKIVVNNLEVGEGVVHGVVELIGFFEVY